MTRTTELLKEIERLNKITAQEEIDLMNGKAVGFKNTSNLNDYKLILRGRLDALKEEAKWLIETFGEEYDYDDFDILLQKRIASIQEEIKLIEGAI